jgi:DNA modification methylase
LNDISFEYDDINKNAHKGRLKRSVWSINTKPSKVKHVAPYPKDLIEPMILCSTDENDIVFDPFLGSGTTGVVASALNRKWIGSELNEEYIEIINNNQ